MFARVLLVACSLALLLLSGCGGSDLIGKNSDIVIHLTRTDGTQVMTSYELYITKRNDASLNVNDPEDFASTVNQPTWADAYSSARSATELSLGFRTRSDQVSYFVFVKVPNTGAQFETLKFQVNVDGVDGVERMFDLTINSTQRLIGVRIDRNAAIY